MAKIGPAGFEISGLTEIVKKKKQQQNIQPAGPVKPGGLNEFQLTQMTARREPLSRTC